MKPDGQDLEQFIRAYMECALWSSCDDDCNPLDDRFDILDLTEELAGEMVRDCTDFVRSCSYLLESLTPQQAGYDFWLTRNGHGAGFWDRGLGELGDRLTKAADVYGAVDLYEGSDGRLYVG